jgi:hypothetical protein
MSNTVLIFAALVVIRLSGLLALRELWQLRPMYCQQQRLPPATFFGGGFAADLRWLALAFRLPSEVRINRKVCLLLMVHWLATYPIIIFFALMAFLFFASRLFSF